MRAAWLLVALALGASTAQACSPGSASGSFDRLTWADDATIEFDRGMDVGRFSFGNGTWWRTTTDSWAFPGRTSATSPDGEFRVVSIHSYVMGGECPPGTQVGLELVNATTNQRIQLWGSGDRSGRDRWGGRHWSSRDAAFVLDLDQETLTSWSWSSPLQGQTAPLDLPSGGVLWDSRVLADGRLVLSSWQLPGFYVLDPRNATVEQVLPDATVPRGSLHGYDPENAIVVKREGDALASYFSDPGWHRVRIEADDEAAAIPGAFLGWDGSRLVGWASAVEINGSPIAGTNVTWTPPWNRFFAGLTGRVDVGYVFAFEADDGTWLVRFVQQDGAFEAQDVSGRVELVPTSIYYLPTGLNQSVLVFPQPEDPVGPAGDVPLPGWIALGAIALAAFLRRS